MNSKPPVNAIAFGESGKGYPIVGVEDEFVALRFPDGSIKEAPLTAVKKWEPASQPRPLAVGDVAKLRGTDRTYTITRLYDVFRGIENDKRVYEHWAELQTTDGQPAYWKVQQLGRMRGEDHARDD